jgi:hypothetical protein
MKIGFYYFNEKTKLMYAKVYQYLSQKALNESNYNIVSLDKIDCYVMLQVFSVHVF